MHISIARNGQKFGPYTIEQVNEYLASGQLLHSDLAWYEGLPEWIPLGTLEGISVAPPPPPPPPVRKRSVVRLILMGFVWSVIFWFGLLMVTGGIVGAFNPQHAEEAGRKFGEILGGPFLLISMILAIFLTVKGKLPGTRFY
jgi:hypothetical protein